MKATEKLKAGFTGTFVISTLSKRTSSKGMKRVRFITPKTAAQREQKMNKKAGFAMGCR
jgi:hypothetical protein